ncbi:MAG TPA: hypothetical protein VLC09_09155 [Polyangiaceae bacterium]|nr:hypothetical protein [Polyangiaceae bacterium]
MTPTSELRELGAFYGVDVRRWATAFGPSLDGYAEWVLGRQAFSFVTLGPAAMLAAAVDLPARQRFQRAAAKWPEAITGIKLDTSERRAPTVYVRCVCPWAEGLAWLSAEFGASAQDVPPARTLYGLGFQGAVVKTYALTPSGFVSWRLGAPSATLQQKDYQADVPWSDIAWPDEGWRGVAELGRHLGFEVAGHVGRRRDVDEFTIYVERRGGIATDRSLG